MNKISDLGRAVLVRNSEVQAHSFRANPTPPWMYALGGRSGGDHSGKAVIHFSPRLAPPPISAD